MDSKLGLTTEQITELLYRLSSDDAFRSLFTTDLPAAIRQLPGPVGRLPEIASGACLRPRQLASKEHIGATREVLAASLLGTGSFLPHMLEEHRLSGLSEAPHLAA